MAKKMQSKLIKKRRLTHPITQTAHWASLPETILVKILKHVHDFFDHVALRSVCSHWRHSFLRNTNPLYPPTPYLLLQSYNPTPKPSRCTLFYNINKTMIHYISLPALSTSYCFASSQGWLVLLEYNSPSMSLHNPLTRTSIQLPPLTTFPDVLGFDNKNYMYTILGEPEPFFMSLKVMNENFITKVVVSPNPTSTNYIALAIFGFEEKKLAFCKLGHNEWTLIRANSPVDDIIHYKGQFYASIGSNLTQICNLEGVPTLFTFLITISRLPTVRSYHVTKKYLVEISGDLILVYHHKDVDPVEKHRTKTTGFQIFKFDNDSQKLLLAMQSIGKYSLFLGPRSVFTTDSPKCRPNCIYFTGGNEIKDFGIFNLKTSHVERYLLPYPRVPSIWLSPSFS